MDEFLEQQKATLVKIYLTMTENCVLKNDELISQEISSDDENIEDIS